jgi:amino acid permease
VSKPRKEKPPERDLISAMTLSAFGALLMFGSSAWTYFHRGNFVIKKDSVPIATYNSLLDLTLEMATHMSLYLGVAFFCICYFIWKAYRKYQIAKKNEHDVA